jgi:hypothetical protein
MKIDDLTRTVVPWLLVLCLAVAGVVCSRGLLSGLDTALAEQAVAAQCRTGGNPDTCLELVRRLGRLNIARWLAAASVALAGIGSALGIGIAIVALENSSLTLGRGDRDKRAGLVVGCTLATVSFAMLVTSMITVARFP